jgi:catechol 2,3-dioxygenase-like lactoylglutathione lyase family enzyme
MLLRVWDVTLTVSDLEKAADFYSKILELPLKYRFSNYAGFDCGGVEIGLVPGIPPGKRAGMPCVDFLVGDIDQVYRTLSERGASFVKERPRNTLGWAYCPLV